MKKKIFIVIIIIFILVLLDFSSIFIFKVKEEKYYENFIPGNTYYIYKGKILRLNYVKRKSGYRDLVCTDCNKDKFYYSVHTEIWYKLLKSNSKIEKVKESK